MTLRTAEVLYLDLKLKKVLLEVTGPVKPPDITVNIVRRVDAQGLLQKRNIKINLTKDLKISSRNADIVFLRLKLKIVLLLYF